MKNKSKKKVPVKRTVAKKTVVKKSVTSKEVAPIAHTIPVVSPGKYSLAKPAEVFQLAKELAKFVKQQNLSMNIKGNEYVKVEGWEFAGCLLGLVPVITDVKNISTYEKVTFKWKDRNGNPQQHDTRRFTYEATCELKRMDTGILMGRAITICTNDESGKYRNEEYAIQSMSQTRCIGKVYRNTIGWLMKAAGYEPTPVEDMTVDTNYTVVEDDLEAYKNEVLKIDDLKDLQKYYEQNSDMHKVKGFNAIFNNRKVEIQKKKK